MKNYLPWILLLFLVIFIFRAWFMPGLITGGDFWPNFKSMYPDRSLTLYAWDPVQGNGFGTNYIPLLWVYANVGFVTTVFGLWLHLPWSIVERIGYLFPFLILSTTSSYILFRKLFPKSKFAVLAPAIYVLNTYILMIVGGGQILGIGMAYALFPYVVYFFLKVTDRPNLRNSLFMGVILAAQTLFDIRIAYISFFALLFLLLYAKRDSLFKVILFGSVIPIIIVLFLHAFWVFPFLIAPRNPIKELGDIYSTTGAVKFFSFATLENSISLLHPNWPSNLFGKVEFMKPEFLLVPVLAFSSLLSAAKKKDKKSRMIIIFSLIALFGAFMAKGSQDPFGGVYLFLFEHFPGMQMFRDPTKFYVLVALSFSILIPYSIESIFLLVRKRYYSLSIFVPVLILIYFAVLIRQAFIPGLPGLFKTTSIPPEYIKLEKLLSEKGQFYRTLWIPTTSRFSYYSPERPIVSAYGLFLTQDYNKLSASLSARTSEKLLEDFSVKYVVVPLDSRGEIYLKDRKYSKQIYEKMLSNVANIPFLKQIKGYGGIGVFKTTSYKGLFWSVNPDIVISYTYLDPVSYNVSIENAKAGDRIIFSQHYDKGWQAEGQGESLISENYNKLNSFVLKREGNNKLQVRYLPQRFVYVGIWISVVSGITLIILYIFKRKVK